ncbi:unnamed protein product, partial [Trichogramma brassicae]
MGFRSAKCWPKSVVHRRVGRRGGGGCVSSGMQQRLHASACRNRASQLSTAPRARGREADWEFRFDPCQLALLLLLPLPRICLLLMAYLAAAPLTATKSREQGEKPKQVTSCEPRGSGVAFSCKSLAAEAAASPMTRSRENNKALRRVKLYGCTYEIYYGARTENAIPTRTLLSVYARPRPLSEQSPRARQKEAPSPCFGRLFATPSINLPSNSARCECIATESNTRAQRLPPPRENSIFDSEAINCDKSPGAHFARRARGEHEAKEKLWQERRMEVDACAAGNMRKLELDRACIDRCTQRTRHLSASVGVLETAERKQFCIGNCHGNWSAEMEAGVGRSRHAPRTVAAVRLCGRPIDSWPAERLTTCQEASNTLRAAEQTTRDKRFVGGRLGRQRSPRSALLLSLLRLARDRLAWVREVAANAGRSCPRRFGVDFRSRALSTLERVRTSSCTLRRVLLVGLELKKAPRRTDSSYVPNQFVALVLFQRFVEAIVRLRSEYAMLHGIICAAPCLSVGVYRQRDYTISLRAEQLKKLKLNFALSRAQLLYLSDLQRYLYTSFCSKASGEKNKTMFKLLCQIEFARDPFSVKAPRLPWELYLLSKLKICQYIDAQPHLARIYRVGIKSKMDERKKLEQVVDRGAARPSIGSHAAIIKFIENQTQFDSQQGECPGGVNKWLNGIIRRTTIISGCLLYGGLCSGKLSMRRATNLCSLYTRLRARTICRASSRYAGRIRSLIARICLLRVAYTVAHLLLLYTYKQAATSSRLNPLGQAAIIISARKNMAIVPYRAAVTLFLVLFDPSLSRTSIVYTGCEIEIIRQARAHPKRSLTTAEPPKLLLVRSRVSARQRTGREFLINALQLRSGRVYQAMLMRRPIGTCDSDFSSNPYLWQWRRQSFSCENSNTEKFIKNLIYATLFQFKSATSQDCAHDVDHDFALSSIWRIRSWKIREAKVSEKCGENETIKSERYSMHLFKNQVAALTTTSHYLDKAKKIFHLAKHLLRPVGGTVWPRTYRTMSSRALSSSGSFIQECQYCIPSTLPPGNTRSIVLFTEELWERCRQDGSSEKSLSTLTKSQNKEIRLRKKRTTDRKNFVDASVSFLQVKDPTRHRFYFHQSVVDSPGCLGTVDNILITELNTK